MVIYIYIYIYYPGQALRLREEELLDDAADGVRDMWVEDRAAADCAAQLHCQAAPGPDMAIEHY